MGGLKGGLVHSWGDCGRSCRGARSGLVVGASTPAAVSRFWPGAQSLAGDRVDGWRPLRASSPSGRPRRPGSAGDGASARGQAPPVVGWRFQRDTRDPRPQLVHPPRIWWTGVAVRMSRPNTEERHGQPGPDGGFRRAGGEEADECRRRRAWRCAPRGSGMPSARTRPQAAKARTTVPMAKTRLVALTVVGPRRTWRPKAKAGRAARHTPPRCRRCRQRRRGRCCRKSRQAPPLGPRRQRRGRSAPGRGRHACVLSGSRSRPAAYRPAHGAAGHIGHAIQVVRKARKGQQQSPPWASLHPCGRTIGSVVVDWPGATGAAARARCSTARVAMMAGYVIVVQSHGAHAHQRLAPGLGRPRRWSSGFDLGRRHADGGVERRDLGRPVTTR